MEPPKPEFSVEGNLGVPRARVDEFLPVHFDRTIPALPTEIEYEASVDWLSYDTVGYDILFLRAGNSDLGNFQRTTFQLLGIVHRWILENAYVVSRCRNEQDSIVFRRMWIIDRLLPRPKEGVK